MGGVFLVQESRGLTWWREKLYVHPPRCQEFVQAEFGKTLANGGKNTVYTPNGLRHVYMTGHDPSGMNYSAKP